MPRIIERLYQNEEGQGLLEYALIISFVVIVVVSVLTVLGGIIKEPYVNISGYLSK